MLSSTLTLNFCYLTIIHILHPRDHPKIIRCILKNKQKNKCVCILEIIRLILMKMTMKMKNISQRFDINKPRPRHGYKYTRYKKCLSMMMLIFINILTGKKLCFTQFITRMAAWLLLAFFVCLHNQLISIHSIIIY